ncbi:NTP transferase domain-containing protein [Altererythrobacter soli]|uniref:NTP transferase domain-containing protein n=1 Tax=Croceibacterium soli TaxID=1739690 RepID=A0A6I4URC5_9SPHN|nr:nucleotidyltransferase family protein [Croceibacterium soli]MXP41540.1 NTP transferase domain-containing protein [Croceibacterium soli]
MSGLAIAILAAGSASRFGGGKLDAELAGKPLGRWALDTALEVEHERLAVVVGDAVPEFARVAGCEVLVNDRAGEGLGTSAALAAKWAAESGSEALLILLADMPLVSRATLGRLASAALAGTPASVHYPERQPGVPAAFPAVLFPALQMLSGDVGAARVLRGRTDVMMTETATDELLDVDRLEELAEVAELLRRSQLRSS